MVLFPFSGIADLKFRTETFCAERKIPEMINSNTKKHLL